jgi:hypothetical protein
MPISKITQSPTQVQVSFHQVAKLETNPGFETVRIGVRSFGSEEGAKNGAPIAWYWELDVLTSLITSLTTASLEGILVANPESPFYGGVVIVEESNLEQARRLKWMQIKARRDAGKSGGFKLGERWFHSDEPSRAQYGVLLTTAVEKSLPTTWVLDPEWKDMRGIKAPMTVADLRGIRDVGLMVEATLFYNAERHRAAMEASDDPATYDFTTGWPPIYGATT